MLSGRFEIRIKSLNLFFQAFQMSLTFLAQILAVFYFVMREWILREASNRPYDVM